jgi:hypothetical protein
VRWGGSKEPGLEVAQIALDRAVRQSGSVKYAFQLGTTCQKLRKYGPALDAFAKVLASGDGHRKEALAGAAVSITYADWDGDGDDDDVTGFDRPQVQAALGGSKQPWVADVYERAIQTFLELGSCAPAQSGVAQFAQRFPTHGSLPRLQADAQACHP